MNTRTAPPSSRWTAIIIILATAGAAALRLPHLDRRPMHGDEAVHADKLHTLWQTGEYHYDPNEYHGPTLYYLTLPVLKLAGCRSFADFTEAQLRLVPALLGIALIPMLWLVRDGLGSTGVIVAALLTAVSTAMTFYSRYYIQEMLLVFFTFLMLAAGWRYWRTRGTAWVILSGVAAGLMHATKETSVIAFGCAAAAIAVGRFSRVRTQTSSSVDPQTVAKGVARTSGTCFLPGDPRTEPCESKSCDAMLEAAQGLGAAHDAAVTQPHPRRVLPGLLLAGAVAILTSALFYSAFLTNLRGPLDSLLTYRTYFDRAGNHGLHNHPWWYYLQILAWTKWAPGPWWSEGVVLALFIIGAFSALRRGRELPKSEFRNPKCSNTDPAGGATARLGLHPFVADCVFLRFMCIYTVLMLAAYSAILYKTPWCMVGFLHGMILIAGAGFAALIHALRRRLLQVLICVAFAAALGHLAWQTQRADGRFCADNRNPYVYAHPVGDVLRLAGFISRLRDAHPNPAGMVIQVVSPDADYWPLPWYVRGCENVGYWSAAPGDSDADVLISPAAYWPALKPNLTRDCETFYYGLRPDVPLVVAVEKDLWQRFREKAKD
ncbi:MAG: TIGR03663 family protein [Phycisphaerales bacterium]|nr:TIGR03663 family protein [Phycisphaerales bacterium]